MRIYTRGGDLAFKTFTFPDGQPHFKLETYEREFDMVTVETAIKSPLELITLVLAVSVLHSAGYSDVRLNCRYLLGARMDRAISWAEPFTLDLVSRIINGCCFSKVSILDVHSEVATKLIRNCENVLPVNAVRQVMASIPQGVVISPDKGASKRVMAVAGRYVQCNKRRDEATGALHGFEVLDSGPLSNKHIRGNSCLIVDDICDGGGTFVGTAKALRELGAKKVYLYVTHGIFSKGLPLEGIDHIYTTDSYYQPDATWFVDPTRYNTRTKEDDVTCIPVSMEKL